MTAPQDKRWQARPTWYRGTLMRSRTEARVAGFLDREGLEWRYEPFAFADSQRQYLPDFQVSGLTGSLPMYVEVKGPHLTTDETDALLDAMSVIHTTEPAVLAVWTDERFGRNGIFRAQLSDGRRGFYQLRRCRPCGLVTLRAACDLCERQLETMSPLDYEQAA